MTDPAPAKETDDRLDSRSYSLARYRELSPRLAFRARTRAEVAAWKESARAKLVELVGGFPTDRLPLNPEYGPRVQRPGYTRRSVTFATRPGMSAFGYVLMPDTVAPKSAAVLCIPGHGSGVDEIVGIDEKGKDRDHLDGYQHDFAVQCVQKGYVTLALEPLGFGHRRDPASRKKGKSASSCLPAAGAALMLGETMVGWRCWDAFRALDLLETMPEVDPKRLAMIGISGGGTVILYAAALDDRVKVSVLSGSFCTYKDSIFTIAHCMDNYVPGILPWFEAADITGLIAPRYVFCESGTQDDIFPEPGVRTALKEASTIFRTCGAEGHIDHEFFDAGHSFHGEAAFRRLQEWL